MLHWLTAPSKHSSGTLMVPTGPQLLVLSPTFILLQSLWPPCSSSLTAGSEPWHWLFLLLIRLFPRKPFAWFLYFPYVFPQVLLLSEAYLHHPTQSPLPYSIFPCCMEFSTLWVDKLLSNLIGKSMGKEESLWDIKLTTKLQSIKGYRNGAEMEMGPIK